MDVINKDRVRKLVDNLNAIDALIDSPDTVLISSIASMVAEMESTAITDLLTSFATTLRTQLAITRAAIATELETL